MLSTIEKYYVQSADVTRLEPATGSDFVEQYGLHLSDVPCYIEPLEESFSEDLQGSFGKEFYMFCAPADILEGDRVTIDSVTYKVTSVETYNTVGSNVHMEMRIRQSND